MKNIKFYLFTFVVASLAFAGCQEEPSSAETNPEENGAVIQDADVVSSDGMPVITGPDGLISPQTRSMLENLTRDYWYIEQWVEIKQQKRDRESGEANRGRWFNFSMDGSVTAGKLDKEDDKGSWEYEPKDAHLVLNLEEQGNMEFSLKMANDGRVMLWVGTERYNQNNIQLKLENYVEQMNEMPQITN
ncbi:MAG: hypothetical protein GYB31_06815 [Bacteroidetes bacterium]|nr:hypothetical protein [Bacteroidota bacterium]